MSSPAGSLAIEVRQLLKTPSGMVHWVKSPEPGQKPIGPYPDFDACVQANQDADDPEAYCGAIQAAVEGKETPWMDEKPWTGWKFETFIGDEDIVDTQRERVRDEDYLANLPFLVKYGYFEWLHTGQKIGEFLAWRYEKNPMTGNVGPKVRVGLIDPDDPVVPPAMKGELKGARIAIEEAAERGKTSINGMWTTREECDGQMCWKVTDHMALWAVGWVSAQAANVAALTTAVGVKADAPKQNDPDRICGQLWSHGTPAQREAFGGGTEGRGQDDRPPAAWWGDCVGSVAKMTGDELGDFVKGLPGQARLKAEFFLQERDGHPICGSCKAFYDSAIGGGFTPKAALAMLQEKLDTITGWSETLKTPSPHGPPGRSSMSADPTQPPTGDPATPPTGDPAPKPSEKQPPEGGCPEGQVWDAESGECVPKPEEGEAGKNQPDYIALAAVQELAKRVESLEMAQSSTTPKMVDEAVKAVKTEFEAFTEDQKAMRTGITKIDTRLGALEAFAGRQTLGLGQKSFTPPPRDAGPAQGLTQTQLLEKVANVHSFGEMQLALRKAANEGGE